ncbi:MAG: hypothetical protein GY820_46685, partial [Gammaproteobacteria bacterium]|nr:hypothetical protein [Gammaproteobacteria bacterium]
MPKEFEQRLRELQFSLPSQQDSTYVNYLVIIAMHGHPVFFRLSDFAQKNNQDEWCMVFPKQLQSVLAECTLLVWGKEEFVEHLENTYQGSPGWEYMPEAPAVPTKRSLPMDWSIIDLGLLNRGSVFGERPNLEAKDYYGRETNRGLLHVLHKLCNDHKLIQENLRLIRARVAGMDRNYGLASGFIGPGPIWGQGNQPEVAVVTNMVMQAQGLWYYILAEVIY